MVRKLVVAFACLIVLAVAAAPAHAQAPRTWVSGVGDDANPCARTSPCRTFQGAISKTAAGGVISVLDPQHLIIDQDRDGLAPEDPIHVEPEVVQANLPMLAHLARQLAEPSESAGL